MLRPCTDEGAASVTVVVEGREVSAWADETVASVLLRLYGTDYRTEGVAGEARAPYCMIGACFECMAEVDGVANRQACMVTVRQGMAIRRQRGRAEAR